MNQCAVRACGLTCHQCPNASRDFNVQFCHLQLCLAPLTERLFLQPNWTCRRSWGGMQSHVERLFSLLSWGVRLRRLTVLGMTWLSVMESGSVYFLSHIYVSILPRIVVWLLLQNALVTFMTDVPVNTGACRFLYEHWLNRVSIKLSSHFHLYGPFFCFQRVSDTLRILNSLPNKPNTKRLKKKKKLVIWKPVSIKNKIKR